MGWDGQDGIGWDRMVPDETIPTIRDGARPDGPGLDQRGRDERDENGTGPGDMGPRGTRRE